MAPISKSSTYAWTRRTAPDHRCSSIPNSDGSSSNYSSGEENPRPDKKNIPSFMLNDDLDRSYVDPWDMENYSFLRRQLEDVNLGDSELSCTPAFESAHSDFYYVPLDTNGSPQYQFKHYVDVGTQGKDGMSTPFAFRTDSHGLIANIDERDFCNEHLDTPGHSLQSGSADSFPEMSSPSRQSERSRYNNHDYQTYMPPSIIKDDREAFETGYDYLTGKFSGRHFSDLNLPGFQADDRYGFARRRKNVEFELKENVEKSVPDGKATLNRRKSFHELTADFHNKPERRRKSVLDDPQKDDYRPVYDIGVPDYSPREGIGRRKSIHDIAADVSKIGKIFVNQKSQRKSIWHSSESSDKTREKIFEELRQDNLPRPYLSPLPESSLVYVYETPKRRRKIVLPDSNGSHRERRYGYFGCEDGFTMDPMENFANQPVSRYTMTSYGHLKIDYSCSWNCLDEYIHHRIRT